jgi:hypothetical protein
MTHWNEDHLPDDVREVANWLREERPRASALDLDRMKLEARSRAARPPAGKARIMRAKLVTMMLVAGLMASGGTAAVIANHDNGNGKSNDAGLDQYKPGLGCGDKNHVHLREDECKKPPK